jgi:transaldolase
MSSPLSLPQKDPVASDRASDRARVAETFRSPLHKMALTTPTDLWNDSCGVRDLRLAIEHGAVGATSNPTIVLSVLQQEFADWKERIFEIFGLRSTWTEAQIAWQVIEEMALRGAALLLPIFEQTGGKKGFLSIQTNPEFYRSSEALVTQALHFASLAPNIQVKIPATAAGIAAIEEVTSAGVSVNATVCFTVPQAIAVAQAVERGLKRRESQQLKTDHIVSVCTIMVGRLDDWMKVCAEKQKLVPTPGALDWAGVACMKHAYKLFNEAGYRTRLLAAAYRNHLHWSEFIGGNVVLTIPPAWQARFNASSVAVIPRMDNPVPAFALTELSEQFEDFRKAYDPKGLKIQEFDSYGATARTLRAFLGSYYELLEFIRNLRLPNPDN